MVVEGKLDLLQHARARGCPYTTGRGVADCAASRGQLAVLIWLRSLSCPFGTSTCAAAAMGGHLAVLQWLHEDCRCAWDTSVRFAAAANGRVDVLEWVLRQGCGPAPLRDFEKMKLRAAVAKSAIARGATDPEYARKVEALIAEHEALERERRRELEALSG